MALYNILSDSGRNVIIAVLFSVGMWCVSRRLKGNYAIAAPAVSYLYTALLLARNFPTGFTYITALQGIGSIGLLTFFSGSNPIALRMFHFPAVASIVALLSMSISERLVNAVSAAGNSTPVLRWFSNNALVFQSLVPTSKTAVVLLVWLQLHCMLGAVATLLIYPAPFVPYMGGNIAGARREAERTLVGPIKNNNNNNNSNGSNGEQRERTIQYVTVPSASNTGDIDCMVVRIFTTSTSSNSNGGSNAKTLNPNWMMYFGGNGEVYEFSWEGASALAEALNVNLIMFNPRGVGRSTGYVPSVGGLVSDARTVVAYMIEKENIPEERLLLFGHSIGGGVVAELARTTLRNAPVVFDRTFSKLTDVAVQFMPFPGWMTKAAIILTTGNLNTIRGWNSLRNVNTRKLILYHLKDNVIMYSAGSLARFPQFHTPNETLSNHVAEVSKKNDIAPGSEAKYVTRLTGGGNDPHNVYLTAFPSEYPTIVKTISNFFPKK